MTGTSSSGHHALVTGAGGMSGAAIVDALLMAGWRVTALVAPWSAGRLAGRSGEGLVVKPCDLAFGIPDIGPLDMIVHTAARSPGPDVGADAIARTNVMGASSVATRAAVGDVRTVINFSSLSVYGIVSAPEVDEGTARVDPDAYGQSKWLAEAVIAEGTGGYRSLSLRLPGILGPGAGRNWLSRVWDAARRGETITIANPDGAFNNAVHVDDLARFVVALAGGGWSERGVVTLGAGGLTTVLRVVKRLVVAGGSRSSIAVRPAQRPGFTVSSRRAAETFGYQPMDIDAMLDRYVDENRY